MTLARFALLWAVNALALWIADELWDGVVIEGWSALLIGAAELAEAKAFVKPVNAPHRRR